MNKRSSQYLLKQMWHRYTKKHAWKLLIAVLFMLAEGGAMFVFLTKLRPLIDQVFTAGNVDQIVPITITIAGVFVIRAIASFVHRSITVGTGLLIVGNLQKDLAKHLLKLDISFFNKHSPGELIERVRGDTQALQSFASNMLLTLGRDTAMLLGMLGAAIMVDWKWTAIIFIGAPILVLPIGMVQKFIRRFTLRARETSANLSTRLDEIFHGIKAVRLNNLEKHENQRFGQEVKNYVQTTHKSEMSKALLPSIIDIVAGIGFVAVIIYGGREISNGAKTPGDFIQFFAAIAFMFDPIRRITNISGAIQGVVSNLERIFYLFDQKPKARTPSVTKLSNPKGDIRFENVLFSYEKNLVLNDLSFVAPGGKTTAFVGPSGAGKSTLFNVLTQLEVQQAGHIFIGDDDIATVDLKDLRNDIAVVSQESALFDESIRDNIRLGDLAENDERVENAANLALVKRFADELPDGLDSLAGPRGTNLSGGQRQRVIIARALLRNAPILLLDEATSALDNQTEQKIQALLEEFTENKTTLVIAHRLSTVMNADLIHVMKDGAIVESGTHQELLALNAHYAQLHTTLEK